MLTTRQHSSDSNATTHETHLARAVVRCLAPSHHRRMAGIVRGVLDSYTHKKNKTVQVQIQKTRKKTLQ